MPGATENVSQLRSRYQRLANSISALEALVSNQQVQLDMLHRQHESGNYSDDEMAESRSAAGDITDEMLRREEAEIAALERQRDDMEEDMKRMDVEMGKNMRGLRGS